MISVSRFIHVRTRHFFCFFVRMGIAYEEEYPDPRYGRRFDMDLDGDVDFFDLVTAAGNYGDSW
ncbi:MAG TPA: hypothetical protein VMW14_02160 [Candidatus Paceibacterota bacterium]|nr:hypothetical protein [Candidatus Paceibacterota bacterium]